MKQKKFLSIALVCATALSLSTPALAIDAGFVPNGPVTRGTLAQVLYDMEGKPNLQATTARFEDAQGEWYAGPAVWCKEYGIFQGNERADFDGDRIITRAELATVLYRYAQYKKLDVSAAQDTNLLSYDDALDLPAWATEGFQWAGAYGVLDGVSVGSGMLLDYNSTVTRGEFVTIVDRLAELVGTREQVADPLSLWSNGSASKAALVDYMTAITDPNSPDFIPVKDRVAVFDLDGTLFCETDPNYFDYTLLKYRVLEDPDYKDTASDFEREVANKIKEQNETGKSFSGLEVDHGKAVASAFAGMTVAEFNAYIQEFKKQSMPSYEGMKRGEGFYQPMVEVVNYLQENEFTVYVVSGTDRLIVWGILDHSVLNIPNRQIIGSDETIVSSNQGDTDGLNYVFTKGDALTLGGEFLIKNLKMNKVSVIMQEIGQQPVLSFGNSSGDASMANYVIGNNPYRSAAFMLCCDDLVRENGNTEKADSMRASCEKNGWVAISMRDDWTTIYGDQVQKISAQS